MYVLRFPSVICVLAAQPGIYDRVLLNAICFADQMFDIFDPFPMSKSKCFRAIHSAKTGSLNIASDAL